MTESPSPKGLKRDGFARLMAEVRHDREKPVVADLILEEGRTFGDFQLIRLLGRGGMGVVWEAEQVSLGRRVALKLLPPGANIAPSTLRRFQREAEAGGRLAHPGVVQVHAAGETEGVPWIAQELVGDGTTLADQFEALRRMKKPPEDWYAATAELFSDLAQALTVAHEVGVIHRDIKPANILLDADGRAKVADFGLAEVEGSLQISREGDFSGSPFYMSPEQAMAKRMGIDHRTDIFSLGTTLYEALTLQVAFPGDTREEVLGRIVSEDPPEPHKVRGRVPGDLSVICMKAIEKSPSRRYESMAAFAEDLERFLANQPILAKPPGPAARTWKWCLRHPAFATGIGVAGVSFAVISWLLVETMAARAAESESASLARAAAVAAEESAAVASRNAETSERALTFLLETFEELEPEQSRAQTISVADLVTRAGDRLGIALAGEDEVASRLLVVLGRLNRALGRLPEGMSQLSEAAARAEIAFGTDDPRTLDAQFELAVVEIENQDWESAEGRLVGMLAALENNQATSEERFRVRFRIASLQDDAGRDDEAHRNLNLLVTDQQALLGPRDPATLRTLNRLGEFHLRRDRAPIALGFLRQAWEGRRDRFGPSHPETLTSLFNVASALMKEGRAVADAKQSEEKYEQAQAMFDEVLQGRMALYPASHPWVIVVRSNLAGLSFYRGRLEDALVQQEEVFASMKAEHGMNHTDTLAAVVNLARTCLRADRFARAEVLLESAVTSAQSHLGPSHFRTLQLLTVRADSRLLADQLPGAVADAGLVAEPWTTIESAIPAWPENRSGRAAVRRHARALAENGELDRALSLLQSLAGAGVPGTFEGEADLAEWKWRAGQPQSALDSARRVVESLRAAGPLTSLERPAFLRLAAIEQSLGNTAEAAILLAELGALPHLSPWETRKLAELNQAQP